MTPDIKLLDFIDNVLSVRQFLNEDDYRYIDRNLRQSFEYLKETENEEYIIKFCYKIMEFDMYFMKYIPEEYQTQEICLKFISANMDRNYLNFYLNYIHNKEMRDLIRLLTITKQ